MFKRIFTAAILFLSIFSYCHAQGFACPYCHAHIDFRVKVCWLCGRDLTEYWKDYDRKLRNTMKSYIALNYGVAGSIINEEKAKKAGLNEEHMTQANSVVNDIVDNFEKTFAEIEGALPQYYESCDISVLDRVRGQFNKAMSGFAFSVRECSGMIDDCDGAAFNRLDALVDRTNSLRRKIESAKSYVPDRIRLGEFTLVRSGQSHRLSLPPDFSSSRLVVPASGRFNYVDVPVAGLLEGTDLSVYPGLESIEYQGDLLVFDAAQHNACPNLKTVVLNGKGTVPPRMTGGALREGITVHVSQTAIRTYTSGAYEGWDKVMLVAEGDGSDLYAMDGTVYKYDKGSRKASIHHYYKSGAGAPAFLETVAGAPVSAIDDYAFSGSRISGIKIPSTVTRIGDRAFYDCTGLEKVTIPGSVTEIGGGAFLGCRNLKEVTITGQEPPSAHLDMVPQSCWVTVGRKTLEKFVSTQPYKRFKRVREEGGGQYRAYDGNQTYLVNEADGSAKLVKGADAGVLDLPEDVFGGLFRLTGIGTRAFEGCGSLTTLTVPSSVKTIDAEAFSGAPKLTAVRSLGDVPPACDKAIFDKKNACTVYVPAESVKLYKKEKGWKSADEIQGSDVLGGSGAGRAQASSSPATIPASITTTNGATLSGMSRTEALAKWAELFSDKHNRKSLGTISVKDIHTETINAPSGDLECIIADPHLVSIEGYVDVPGDRTEVYLKKLRPGKTTLYVIFYGYFYYEYTVTAE